MNANPPNKERAQELRAGAFVLIGLVFIAVMAFKFGRLGQGLFQTYYPLTVTFPSADGLIKNSDVQLAGARIGYVVDKPVISTGGSGVTIPIEDPREREDPARHDVRWWPAPASWGTSSSISRRNQVSTRRPSTPLIPRKFMDPATPWPTSHAGGLLGGAGNKADEVFDELKVEIKKLTVVTDKINNGILSPQNQKNITDTFANLKGTSEHFNVASKDLDTVVQNAKEAVDSAKVIRWAR